MKPRPPLSRTGAGLAMSVSVLLAVLTGCAAEEPTLGNPYAAHFERARDQAATDFQRAVLADDLITDEELREVRQHYIECLADGGIRAEALDDGSYNVYDSLSGGRADIEAECSDSTIRVIEPLYYEIRVNPRNEDVSALIAQCLQTQGVVGDGFSKGDWDRYVTSFAAAANSLPPGTRGSDADLPKLPGGTPMDDPRVVACSTNPLGL